MTPLFTWLLVLVAAVSTVQAYFYVPNFMSTLPFGGGMATAQRNNSMVLFGGETDSTAYANTLYQLTQSDTGFTWKSLPQNNAAQGAVYAQAIVSQDQSSLMVIGGQGNFSAQSPSNATNSTSPATSSNSTALPLQLQLYNFASASWSTFSPPANTAMPNNRKLFSATYSSSSNKVYIYGGATDEQNVFNDLWVMDGKTSVFTQLKPYYARYGHTGSMTR
jgi:N-acetylneuraminic acid mutarotase